MVKLKSTTAVQARREIKRRWPGLDVRYTGYDKHGDAVIMSLVRGRTTGNVATAVRNRAGKAVRFEATVEPL
jgi:hypothetical protein